MTRFLLPLLFLSQISAWAGISRSPSTGHPATFTIDNAGDAIADYRSITGGTDLADGDTIILPSGTFSLTSALGNGGNMIHIIGGGMRGPNKTTLQYSTTNDYVGALLSINCHDSPETMEIAKLDLLGEGKSTDSGTRRKFTVSGFQTMKHDATHTPPYYGGVNIHDLALSTDPAKTGGLPGFEMYVSGFIQGVMWHCILDENPNRGGTNETLIMNNNGDPTNSSGNLGEYASAYPNDDSGTAYATSSSLVSSMKAFYFEDNIFIHNGALTDVGDGRGGGIYVARHNSVFGAWSAHGTRDSGGINYGGRFIELYNNTSFYSDISKAGSQANYPGDSSRGAGEHYVFNNFMTSQNSQGTGAIPGVRTKYLNAQEFAPSSNTASRFYGGPDGLNPCDENLKKGQDSDDSTNANATHGTDATGDWINIRGEKLTYYKHYIDSGYSITNPNGDTVTSGADSNPNKGDVFAHIGSTGSEGNATVATGDVTANGLTWNNVIIKGIGFQHVPDPATGQIPNPPTIPANYFRGFVIKKPQTAAGNGFAYILSSSGATPASDTSVTIGTITTNIQNPWGCSSCTVPLPPNTVGGLAMEIRRVRQYYGVYGSKQMDTQISDGSDPVKLKASGTPAPMRWTHQGKAMRVFGNQYRLSGAASPDVTPSPTPAFRAETASPEDSVWNLVQNPGEYTHLFGDASTMTAAETGYATWNPSVPAGSKGTDGHVGQIMDSTTGIIGGADDDTGDKRTRIGADWVAAGSGTGKTFLVTSFVNAGNGLWGSFYSGGAAGFDYPHPLRGTAATYAPSITSPNKATWTAGSPNSFIARASGNPTPNFTPVPTVPSGWSITQTAGSGQMTISSGPTPSPTVVPLALVANNGISPNATQTLTITVGTPTPTPTPPSGISVSITSPIAAQIFFTTDTIPLKASASGGVGIGHVDFLDGVTTIGTGTFDSTAQTYNYNWTGAAAGSHNIKARAFETGTSTTADSGVVAITVSPPPVATPTPAVIEIKP